MSSVVKGNAYGHGIEVFVPMVVANGVDHISVFSAAEALRAREATDQPYDLMIMGMMDKDEVEWAVQSGTEFFVFGFDRLEQAINSSKKTGSPAMIHIEVETGLNRTGFQSSELPKVIGMLKEQREHLSLQGLCTHYAGAESIANYLRVKRQIARYRDIHKQFLAEGLEPKYRHTACSASALSYPETRMDLVRIGIAQYGFWPSQETMIQHMAKKEITEDPLKRLITWKSKVMSVKEVRQGDFVGYGTSFQARNRTRIAIVPMGYASGYGRSLSNQGSVLINGKRAPVIGTVNMNMLIADLGDDNEVREGDEVVLIGLQKENALTVASFSEFSNQLNYELLTRLPQDIPRIQTD